MHHIWTIAELRWTLVENIRQLANGLGTRPSTSEYWQTLVALTTVCRDFSDPAVAQIWHDLPELNPILMLMPSVTFSWEGLVRRASNFFGATPFSGLF